MSEAPKPLTATEVQRLNEEYWTTGNGARLQEKWNAQMHELFLKPLEDALMRKLEEHVEMNRKQKFQAENLNIIVSPIGNNEWKLLEGMDFVVFDQKWHVPEGFITDFASIPKVFHAIFSPWNMKHGPAAILHDYLYQYKPVTRKTADDIFLEAMRLYGVGWLKRHIFYSAVRGFGGPVYDDRERTARIRKHKR